MKSLSPGPQNASSLGMQVLAEGLRPVWSHCPSVAVLAGRGRGIHGARGGSQVTMQAQNGGSFPEVRQRQPGTPPPALHPVSVAPARARCSDHSATACLRTGCRAAIGLPGGRLLCTHLSASGSPPPPRWEADARAGLSLLAGPSQPCPALLRPWVPSGTFLPESRGSVVSAL